VEVSRRVLEVADQINAEFPQVKIVPVINQGNFIERSIENVAKSVLYGGLLAVFILLFFLASLRSTGVIGVSIPVSILATLAMIYFAGLTINLTTLGGLALGVGMMVDSSIVVLENVFRRRDEDRETLVVASVTGAREVAGAIVASTITTLVVFLPLAFVRGVSGLLFSELAYVVVFSLVCSLVVSLTLLPMLASRLLASETEPPPWAQRAKLLLQRLNVAYLRVLERALTRPRLAIGSAVALLAASLLLAPLIGTEFLPPSDEGEVRIQGEMEVGTRLSLVDRQTQKMERIVTPAVPEAIASVVNVGASGRRPEQASQGQIQLSIGSAADRDRSNTEIAADLRKRLEGQIPGMRIRVRAPQGSFILERVLGGEEGLAIEIRGFDLERLDALGQVVAAAVRDVDGITDVEVTREAGIPQEEIHIDRAKVADLGLTVRDVTQAIQTAVAGSEAGEYRKEGNSYRILVQLADVEELSLDEVLGLTLRTANGEAVTIGSVVDTRASLGPLVIHRKNQQRIVTVNANVAGRDLGSVASDVEARLAQVPRPAGYEVTVSGAFVEQEMAFSELLVSLALALLLVYMVLASQYESLRDPLIVMLSVPLATIGVLVTLFLTGTTLNVQSYIGCIMLGGIVVNNAILLVDQAGALMRDGRSSREAATEAGRRRLRPILMTTATTILGLLPLALGIGEGADAQAPLARAVIGGLLGSTPVTLVLIPAVFMLVHRKDAS
ncbi:MAG: efflux RND transporter permease subunit, partial [Deltaproteobacteria bacterium]